MKIKRITPIVPTEYLEKFERCLRAAADILVIETIDHMINLNTGQGILADRL
jgi:hypothetical protein